MNIFYKLTKTNNNKKDTDFLFKRNTVLFIVKSVYDKMLF